MKKNKNSKKSRKIWLWTIIIIIGVLVAIAVWQRENIRLMYNLASVPEAELDKRAEYSNKEIDKILESYGLEPIYSEEGEDAPAKDDKIIDIPKPGTVPSKPTKRPSEKTEKNETASEIVKRYVSSMQDLRVSYSGQLDSLMAQAVADYKALPKSERGKAGVSAIAGKYIGTAYSLQSSCDAQVNSLLANLEGELRTIGADTAIVSAMRTAYQNEKSAKIAYYMKKLK